MKGFIEVHGDTGKKLLVNIKDIETVNEMANGCVITWKKSILTATETYDQIKKLITEAQR